jgi:hypothetical protein
VEEQTMSLKEVMHDVIHHGDITIIPERFNRTYFHWIDNLRDWCIRGKFGGDIGCRFIIVPSVWCETENGGNGNGPMTNGPMTQDDGIRAADG